MKHWKKYVFLFAVIGCLFVTACAADTAETTVPEPIVTEAAPEETAIEPELPDQELAASIIVDGVIGDDEYPNSYEDRPTGLTIYWHNDDSNLYFGLENSQDGWAAIGFDPEQAMQGANIIMVAMDGEEALIRDDFGDGPFSHRPDTDLGGTRDIIDYAGRKQDPGYTFEFVIPLDSGDEYDKKLESMNTYDVILAINSSSIDFDAKHTNRSKTSISLQ